jgi:ureidoglycolate lyase
LNAPASVLLHPVALTPESFHAFGDVIDIAGRPSRAINENTSLRYDDLATVDVLEAGGRPLISIFEATPRPLPLHVRTLERHPLSSQAFYPLERRPFLVVVALDGTAPLRTRLRAFLSSGSQGVNYRRNTWHHSLIALHVVSRFLVIDRGGPLDNCEEIPVDDAAIYVTDEL